MKKLQRLMALLMALAMTCALLPAAYAAEADPDEGISVASGGSDFSSAKSIKVGTTITDFGNQGDNYYKFYVPSTGYVTCTFSPDHSNTSGYWDLAVYYSDKSTRLFYDTYYASESGTHKTARLGLKKGTYYIKIWTSYSVTDISYDLGVNFTASSLCETELNDSYATADPIRVGQTYLASYGTYSDYDYYKFTLSSSKKITITLTHDYTKGHTWAFTLYKATSSGYESCGWIRGSGTVIAGTSRGTLSAGTYYINVWNGDSGTNYTLKISNSSSVSLSTPSITSIKNELSGINLTWQKTSGCTGYRIYRRTSSGSYSVVATVGANTLNYFDKNVTNGTTYVYRVRAYYGNVESGSTNRTICRLSAPTLSSVTNSSSKAMTAKWTKNSKADGYVLKYVATTGSFSKTVTYSGSGTVKATRKGLTKGKIFKVYVRSYKTVNGVKYYSAWSHSKSVKISK